MNLADFQRLKHIVEYCEAIQSTIERCNHSFSTYENDKDFQRSIAFSILQIGELSGGLSEEFRKETTKYIQWGPIKGMRNMVAHNYGSMNQEIIWETSIQDIPALKNFCEELTKKISLENLPLTQQILDAHDKAIHGQQEKTKTKSEFER